ncbi:unnamed protein product [Symbiodinium sp. CCMP2592]|nr:unnamed protein product [Symbiodinium sp. CCMP2592]CAE7816822.1 unnamed protein product [Symbiodinium sp. CCMP2592]
MTSVKTGLLTRALLGQPLTIPTDSSLAFAQPSGFEDLRRPPNVSTLKEWGAWKFPQGKWKGRSFLAVYMKEKSFVAWYLARDHFTSAWAKSFLAFCKVADGLVKQSYDDEEAELAALFGDSDDGAAFATAADEKGASSVPSEWLCVLSENLDNE